LYYTPRKKVAKMTGLDALQSGQFVTVHGKHLVVVNAVDWETLL